MKPGTGTAYHPTALPTVGPYALPVPGQDSTGSADLAAASTRLLRLGNSNPGRILVGEADAVDAMPRVDGVLEAYRRGVFLMSEVPLQA